jgi:hypothetical protein
VIHGGTIQYNRQDGVVVVGGAPIGVTLDNNALMLGYAGFGARAIGSGVFVRLDQATITDNTTGVAGVAAERFSAMATTASTATEPTEVCRLSR